jgi:hypothetical protein
MKNKIKAGILWWFKGPPCQLHPGHRIEEARYGNTLAHDEHWNCTLCEREEEEAMERQKVQSQPTHKLAKA